MSHQGLALESVLQTVSTALSSNDVPGAIELARAALEQGLEHPLLLNLRAFWFESQKQNTEALTDLQRAQELAPDDPIILNAVGLARGRLGQTEEAQRCFAEAIARDARFAPAYFNHGWASEELGDLDKARASYLELTQMNPERADSWARLGALSARLGEWPAARIYAGRALGLNPDMPAALIALAACEAAEKNSTAAFSLLTRALENPAAAHEDRVVALGQLGDLYHSQHQYEAAFEAYARANRETRSIHQARFEVPGVDPVPQYLAWLIRYLEKTPAWPRGAPAALPATQHVFIIGFPRSGTTLLEDALAAHPDVVTTGERDALAASVREFMGSTARLDRLKSASENTLAEYRTGYWNRIRELGIAVDGRVLVDKQPYNTMKLPVIARLFPDARIIFALRDPRDVVLSCFRRQFRMNASNFELLTIESAARFYDVSMRLAEISRAKLPLNLIEIRHEDLIANVPGKLREICDFAGISWLDSMTAFAQRQRRRAIATPSASQIVRGVNQESVGRWRNYEKHLKSVLPLLHPWAVRFGYNP